MKTELELLRLLRTQLEEALCNTSSAIVQGTEYEMIESSDIRELEDTLEKLEELE